MKGRGSFLCSGQHAIGVTHRTTVTVEGVDQPGWVSQSTVVVGGRHCEVRSELCGGVERSVGWGEKQKSLFTPIFYRGKEP